MILGIISLISLGAAVLSAFWEGFAPPRYGIVGILATAYSAAGMAMGLTTAFKPDYYKLFPVLAIVLNGAALGAAGLILYMGAYL